MSCKNTNNTFAQIETNKVLEAYEMLIEKFADNSYKSNYDSNIYKDSNEVSEKIRKHTFLFIELKMIKTRIDQLKRLNGSKHYKLINEISELFSILANDKKISQLVFAEDTNHNLKKSLKIFVKDSEMLIGFEWTNSALETITINKEPILSVKEVTVKESDRTYKLINKVKRLKSTYRKSYDKKNPTQF